MVQHVELAENSIKIYSKRYLLLAYPLHPTNPFKAHPRTNAASIAVLYHQ